MQTATDETVLAPTTAPATVALNSGAGISTTIGAITLPGRALTGTEFKAIIKKFGGMDALAGEIGIARKTLDLICGRLNRHEDPADTASFVALELERRNNTAGTALAIWKRFNSKFSSPDTATAGQVTVDTKLAFTGANTDTPAPAITIGGIELGDEPLTLEQFDTIIDDVLSNKESAAHSAGIELKTLYNIRNRILQNKKIPKSAASIALALEERSGKPGVALAFYDRLNPNFETAAESHR